MYNLKGAFSLFSFLIQGIIYCVLSSRLKAAEGGIRLFVKVLYKYCTALFIQHSAFIWRLACSSVHRNLILKDNVTGIWPIKTAKIVQCIVYEDMIQVRKTGDTLASVQFRNYSKWVVCPTWHVELGQFPKMVWVKLWNWNFEQLTSPKHSCISCGGWLLKFWRLTYQTSPSLYNLSSCFSVLIDKVTFFGVLILDNNFRIEYSVPMTQKCALYWTLPLALWIRCTLIDR